MDCVSVIMTLNDTMKCPPGAVFALTMAAGWGTAAVLCFRKFCVWGTICAKIFSSRKELGEFCQVGQVVLKVCVNEAAGALGAGSSFPFWSSICWNQLSHARGEHCPGIWRDLDVSSTVLLRVKKKDFVRKHYYFHIVVHILLKSLL